jgi:5'-nucleotidase
LKKRNLCPFEVENTDRWAVDNNFVALTPLRINLTDEVWLQQMLDTEALKSVV